ncbi:serine/threonine-protein kinase [Embleya scabrispora]|uniref:serine/threonine-protein kinase n=1 Tax=Embleya scabrispora TaxID=159449 RepID=UPI00036EC627|nr:serine/threonine-protein kinase [Embleya scabrispora]MYS87218.1 protein kinase [Streptomyces sp. SID5474]
MVGARYELANVLGSGGMGTVWRARDRVLDRPVAAKVVTTGWGRSASRSFRERSLREAQATARINHPNVVRVYDYVEDDDRLWIVMELLDARSLDTILEEDGPLTPHAAAAVAVQIARALGVVHAHGVIHRDVKPGNVLIARDGHAVLTDFGIAALEGASGLTGTGAILGSPEFMAPERIESDHPGPASDLWSLGVTLCAAVTGASPFRRSTPVATMHAIVIAEPEVPAEIGPLEPLVRDLFRRDPARRPDSAEVEARLDALLAAEGRRHAGDVTRPIPPTTLGRVLGRGTDERGPEEYRPADREPVEHRPDEANDDVTPAPTAHPQPPLRDLLPPARIAPDDGAPLDPLPRVPAAPSPEQRPSTPAGPAHSPTFPMPTRTRRPPRSRRRLLAVLLPLVTLLVAGAVVAALLLAPGGGKTGGDDGRNGSSPGAPPSTSGTGGASAANPIAGLAPYPGASPATPPIPVRTADESTFTWQVPQGWTRKEQDQSVVYTDPAGTSVLTGRTAFQQTTDLLEQWRDDEQNAPRVFRDYRKVAFEERAVLGRKGVVWEYTWTESGAARHAMLAAVIVNGIYIEVDVFSTERQWTRDAALHGLAVTAFTLAGSRPGA